jgi:DNA repair protein RecO (recombination protein O)
MKAIILNKKVFAEGSEIITMYSRELGKVRGLARSVKKPLSKLAFGLEQLFYSEIEIANAAQNFLITGVKPLQTFKHMRENAAAVKSALLATEIILKSTADQQANPELFDYFLEFLEHLEKEAASRHNCRSFFMIQALAFSGYELDFKKCLLCGKSLQSEKDIFFSNRKGGFLCASCSKKVSDAQLLNKQSYSALCLVGMHNFEKQDLQPKTAELYSFSKSFAEHVLERDLKAGSFLV